MDTTAIASAAVFLAPIAINVARGCFSRMRRPETIKKTILVVPTGAGKTTLCENLSKNQSQVMVLDMDAVVLEHATREEKKRLEETPPGLKHDMYFDELAGRVMEYVRGRCKTNPALRVLMVTSSLPFALSRGKLDATIVCAPTREFHNALVEDADPDVTRKLVHGRDTLMDAIPDVKMIRSFSSWTDLETKVRAHLRIVETV